MKRGHISQRMCRACGIKRPQGELIRFAMTLGKMVEDSQYTLPGRGVYCCNEITCRKRLEKNKKVLKLAFRL